MNPFQGNEGIDDEGLKHCTKLKRLVIPDQHKVTTCAPFAATLEELDISHGSNLTDAGLKDVKHLKRLKVNWNGAITTCEPFADTLEELEAGWGSSPPGGIGDEGLKHCTKLKVLDVAANKLVTTCDPFAATLEKVSCGMSGLELTDEGLRHCTKVKEASIDRGKLTLAPFAGTLENVSCHVSHHDQIQRCTQLKFLSLLSNGPTDSVPFSSLTSFFDTLEELTLYSGSLPGELNVFKRLRMLTLQNTTGTITALPSTLEELFLFAGRGAQVNDQTVKACTKLRKLTLGAPSSITTCDPFASTLEELAICDKCPMNDHGLKHCRKLKKLVLSSCAHITHCDPFATTLEKLTVDSHCGLTNASVRRCVRLTALKVVGDGGLLTVRLKDLTYS